jgi:hypothetical protein
MSCTHTGGRPVKLSVRELRIVRAALLMALDGDDSAWDSLSPSDTDLAGNLLDAIPNMSAAEDLLNEDIEDEDDDEDY